LSTIRRLSTICARGALMSVDATSGPRRHRVVEVLREAIVSGRLEAGERLIEERISQELTTSRGPVREALRQLEHEGLVMSFPYRGAVVLGVSEEEVHEVLIPIRLTLERFSFAKALELMDDGDFADLAKHVWVMEQAARRRDLRKVVDGDLGFHEAVLAKSGQPHAVQIWRSIAPRIRSYFLRYGKYRDLSSIVAEHRDLLATLQTRDRAAVLEQLEAHIAVKSPEPQAAR
jgi:DNA-binding GntR family transcriptional regulator